MLRNAVTRLSEDKGTIGFDFEYGWGVISGCRLSGITNFTNVPSGGPGTGGAQPSEGLEDEEFMEALAAFREPGEDVAAAAPDVCGTYKKVKPILKGILPFLKFIPNIGKPAAKAIESLMAALDAFCGTSPVSSEFSLEGSGVSEENFASALSEFEQSGSSVAAAAADICTTYKKVKPILEGLLPFLALIPNIGKPVVAALKALMAALDAHCGA
jgi:hypothetical protein